MILHVACLPFPSHQGTQAALAAMLQASASAGRTPQLLAYARAAYELDTPYEVHRIPDFPTVRSLRSGPSWGKLALDARCVVETRKLALRLRPKAIVAHHIEAALAALAARTAPVYYVAHTSLTRELPVYFPSLPGRLVSGSAKLVEETVCARAAGVAAVAPSLAKLLGNGARYLPIPWTTPPSAPPPREDARSALHLERDAQICLYAGNLDHYQGWEQLMEALAALQRNQAKARLLVATESDPGPAQAEASRIGVGRSVDFRRLDGERARRLVHAASDLAWIPRRTEGGLPIKMLDAFARGLPVVATERATAALPLAGSCITVPDDDAEALADGARGLLDSRHSANTLRARAQRYLAEQHSIGAFNAAMRALLAHRAPALSTYEPTGLFLDPS